MLQGTQLEQLHVAFKTRISPPPLKSFFFLSSSPSIHPSDRQLGRSSGVVKENKCSGFQVSFQNSCSSTDGFDLVNPPAVVVFEHADEAKGVGLYIPPKKKGGSIDC